MPCDVQVELVKFTPPPQSFQEGGGIQTITHPKLAGIIPKGVILHWVRGDPESEGDACWGTGACSEDIDQWGVSWAMGEGVTTTSTDYVREARIVEVPPCDGDSSSQANLGNARVDHFVPGGFQMTWFNGQAPTVYDVEGVVLVAIIFAGQDVMTAAGKHDIDSTPFSIDTIGFPPDGIYVAHPAQDAVDADLQAGIHGSYGWADLQTINNTTYEHEADSGQAVSGYQENMHASQAAGTQIFGGADDYTVRYTDPGVPDNLIGTEAVMDAGTDADEIPFFAFRAAGADVRAGVVNPPSGPGPWVVTDPLFRPQAVLLMPTVVQSLDQNINRDAFFGLSAFTDDDQFAHWVNYENNSAAPIARTGHQAKAAFLQDRITPAVLADGSFVSFDVDGWTLDFDVLQQGGAPTPPQNWFWGYLAIGECPAAAVPATAEEVDPNCVDDVWTGPPEPSDPGIADVLVAMDRFQVDLALGAEYEFTTDELNGKTPKAALFLANYTTATSGQETDLDFLLSHGAASKSPGGALRRWVLGGFAEDAEATPTASRAGFSSKVIVELNRSGSTQENASGHADILDFIPDGVRLRTTRAFSEALNVVVVFFAGDDLEAYARYWDQLIVPSGSLVGGLGFQPDLLITAKAARDLEVGGDFAVSSRVGLGGVNLRQDDVQLGTFQQSVNNGGSVQAGAAVLNPTKTGTAPNTTPFPRQTDKVLASNRFGDGFEAVLSDADDAPYLALRLPGTPVWFDSIDPPIATGDWVVDAPGFMPQFVMLVKSMVDLEGDTDGDVVVDARAGSVGVGVFTPTQAEAVAGANEIGASPTNAENSIDANPVYLNDDAGAAAFRASFVGMRINGWRLNFTAADATQRKWLGLAIGQPGPL